MRLIFDVFAPTMMALFLGSLPSKFLNRRALLWVLAIVPLAILIDLSLMTWGELPLQFYESPRVFGQYISFKPQPLGLLFAQLAAALSFFVFLFSGDFVAPIKNFSHQKFWIWMHVFLTAMLGIFLADNLLCLFVFWELSALASYFLIATGPVDQQAQQKATRTLLVLGLGSLALLVGLLLLGQVVGSLDMGVLLTLDAVSAVAKSELSVWIVALIVFGAASKSALFPFSFWLSDAMVAPSPVSALLHSATLVKAGIYVLMLVAPVLSIEPFFGQLLIAIAIATVMFSLQQSFLSASPKKLLASSTLASMGFCIFLIGLGGQAALSAVLAFILAHGFYKCALFLGAGLGSQLEGADDLRVRQGLLRRQPLVSFAVVLALLSMVGAPLFWGSDAKAMIFEALIKAERWQLLLGSALLVAAMGPALRLLWPMLGVISQKKNSQPAPLLATLSLILMAVSPVFFAVYSKWPKALIGPVVQMLSKAPFSFEVHDQWGQAQKWMWSVGLTIVSLGFLFSKIDSKTAGSRGSAVWDWMMKRMTHIGAGMFETCASLSLTRQLMIVFLSVVACAGAVWPWTPLLYQGSHLAFNAAACLVLIFGCLGTLALMRAHEALTRLMGVVFLGLIQSALYLIYGAPDVALAQILVELILLFFLASLYGRLKDRTQKHSLRFWGVATAVAFGLGIGFLSYAAVTMQLFQPISSFYTEQSVDRAHAKNVVNAIIADFRGLDTLGEISVLGIAALSLGALWARKKAATK